MKAISHSDNSALPIRILHVVRTVDPRAGGPIEGILRQNEAMEGAGLREIVSLDHPDEQYLIDFPVKVYPMGVCRQVRHRASKIAAFGFTPKLIPWLREHAKDYDCVVVNGVWNYSSAAASLVLPQEQTPYFVFTHGMLDPWFRRAYPAKHVLKQLFWCLFEGRLLSRAEAVLFTTDEERALAAGEFWGFRYNAEVISYGTADTTGDRSVQISAFRSALPSLGSKPYILFLSRIHQKKGCDLLVEAFKDIADKWPDLDLVIAGPDDHGLGEKLRSSVEAARLSHRVHWPGMLIGNAKWGAFKGAEVFVLPSHQENFGIVVAEALACSTPVVITNRVNTWREVHRFGAGFVCDDIQSDLMDKLSHFLNLTAEERTGISARARQCFLNSFDVIGASAAMLARFRVAVSSGKSSS